MIAHLTATLALNSRIHHLPDIGELPSRFRRCKVVLWFQLARKSAWGILSPSTAWCLTHGPPTTSSVAMMESASAALLLMALPVRRSTYARLPLHIRLWALVHVWTRMEGGRHTVRSKLDPKFASRCVPRTLVVSGTGPMSGGAETGACYTSGVQIARLDGLATIRVTACKSRGQRRTITGRSASGKRPAS